MREIALDTETTGLSYNLGDRITEIGCVEIVDKILTGKKFHLYINPEREVGERAEEISGLTYSFLKKFKPFRDVFQDFLEFIGDARLVIHNAPFDVGFLNFELERVSSIKKIDSRSVVDTLVMAKQKFPGSPSTLDALCRRFSIDTIERVKHGALIDAKLLAEVYINLSVERFQKDLFASSSDKISMEAERFDYSGKMKQRIFVSPQDELKKHLDFIFSSIPGSLWNKYNNSFDELK